jgi:4-coumarate--CoA ligase
MTVGYTTNKESLGESLDEDGFYKTGDLGYYDEEMDIYYVDRMKALIK